MRIELPRGQWAEFEDLDGLPAGVGKAVRRATKFKIEDGSLAEIHAGIADDQRDALLRQIVTSWEVRDGKGASLGLPRFDRESLDAVPIDVYNALAEAAQPYLDAIDSAGKARTLGNGNGSTATSSPASPVPPILQGSAESIPASSDAPSNGAGSPNDGTGLPPSQTSSPSSL